MMSARVVGMLAILTVLGACSSERPPSSHAPRLPQQAALPETTEGAPYEASLAATGGTPPLSYSAERIPPGFSFQADAALLKGPAIAAGRYSLTVQVRDSQGASDTRTYELYVHTAPSVRTATLPSATVGQAYVQQLEASGGRPPLRWSLASGTLPLGFSLTEAGQLSGTPLEPGSHAFTVRVLEASGAQATRPLSLSVQPGQGDGGTPDGGSPDGGSGSDGGTSVPLRVGNWNIEWFGSTTEGPTNEQLQLNNARTVLASVDVDFWGLAEIVDTAHFNALKQQLPGYQGFLANDSQWVSNNWWYYSTNEQKVGVLFRTGAVQVLNAEVILTQYDYEFAGRPPLRVDLRFTRNGVTVDLVAIVLHLKATVSAPTADYQRRKDASLALQQYLDTYLPTARVMVVGDWNDDLDRSIVKDPNTGQYLETPFKNFLDAPAAYSFTTLPLAATERSTVSYSSFIDHQLTSNELAEDFVPNSAYVLKPALTNYGITTSDHYPVISRFDFGHLPPPPPPPHRMELRLTSPNGGESFPASTVQDITWTSDGGTSVRLEYSVDDGFTWQELGSVPAGAGRYTVTLPTESLSQVRVRVSDTADSGVMDMSDGPFSVTWPPPVFINEYLPREPRLPDGGNDPGPEFVELMNDSAYAVDLSGWMVNDLTAYDGVNAGTGKPRHTFDAGTRLEPGKARVVFSKAWAIPAGLTNAEASSSGAFQFNQGGDIVYLQGPQKQVVDSTSYSTSYESISYNRTPDATREGTFVLHTTLPSGGDSSPGQRADGSPF